MTDTSDIHSKPHLNTAIEVIGACTHNLKGIDCRIPHGRFTVVTGPSGAGKSSLAFDTIYAEGQRRFVESMSTYARQFLQQMERPPVEAVNNILPAVALEAKNSVRNARSTVGTITEAHDVLRLLFTHLGVCQCPRGHGAMVRSTPQEAASALAAGAAGDRFLLVVRLARPKRQANEALAELIRQGFARRLDEVAKGGAAAVRMQPGQRWFKKFDPLPLVLGRFRSGGGEAGMRLSEAVADGYRLGGGFVEAIGESEEGPVEPPVVRFFARQLCCPRCGERRSRPVPALFSFNSPLGACPQCQGFGRVVGIDPQRVIPDPQRSLQERAIAAWNTPAYEDRYEKLFAACRKRKISLTVPWEELPEEARQFVWSGKGDFTNLNRFFAWLERRIYKVHVRVLLARYRSYTPCGTCGAQRLRPEALNVLVDGKTLPELTALSIERLRDWLSARQWSEGEKALAGHLLEELGERIEVLYRVGLGYLTLDRQARTLSGGETQRIHLAAALGSGLTSTLYVLDEPTIGLHPEDSDRLVALLRDLAERGNTVLVVEHDRTLIRGADFLIDLGPKAGEHGGEVIAAGTVDEVLSNEASLTARFMRERSPTAAREHVARYRRERGRESLEQELKGRKRVRIVGARAHNLRGFDVEFPLASMVAISGVSGSGKSTLVENVLYGTYQRARGVVDVEPGEVDALHGLEELADVTLVDQRPLGRSARSNPITYIKAYDEIRKLLASTRRAKRYGITPAHFSFNVDRGRCPACKGTGVQEVDMHFMAPVSVVCDECQGERFQRAVLAVRYNSKEIAQILRLTVEAAVEFFAASKKLVRRLRLLMDVGLGYLRLGQPTSTLSGGEAQRLKLASFLDRPAKEGARLFIFDEPTTGLHLADVELLYQTLRRLVKRGDGVVVVEHSSDLISRADWIVDLGPGGGVHGGDLLYSGPLEPFLDHGDGPTVRELRRHLKWPDPD